MLYLVVLFAVLCKGDEVIKNYELSFDHKQTWTWQCQGRLSIVGWDGGLLGGGVHRPWRLASAVWRRRDAPCRVPWPPVGVPLPPPSPNPSTPLICPACSVGCTLGYLVLFISSALHAGSLEMSGKKKSHQGNRGNVSEKKKTGIQMSEKS